MQKNKCGSSGMFQQQLTLELTVTNTVFQFLILGFKGNFRTVEYLSLNSVSSFA